MGVKDVVGKLVGQERPDPADIADLVAADEHAERELRRAREAVPNCDDIEEAKTEMEWQAVRFHALETRRRNATSKVEEAAVRAIMGLVEMSFRGWTEQYEFLYRDAIQRGHGRNYAHARALREKRTRSLFGSGNEAA